MRIPPIRYNFLLYFLYRKIANINAITDKRINLDCCGFPEFANSGQFVEEQF